MLQAPLHYSNVMLVDPLSKKPVRTYFMYEDQPPYKRVRASSSGRAGRKAHAWQQQAQACARHQLVHACRQPACAVPASAAVSAQRFGWFVWADWVLPVGFLMDAAQRPQTELMQLQEGAGLMIGQRCYTADTQ